MKLVHFGYSCVVDFRFNTRNAFSRLSQQVMATENTHSSRPPTHANRWVNSCCSAHCSHLRNTMRSSGQCNTFHYSNFWHVCKENLFCMSACFSRVTAREQLDGCRYLIIFNKTEKKIWKIRSKIYTHFCAHLECNPVITCAMFTGAK